jgi:uncharacterized protein
MRSSFPREIKIPTSQSFFLFGGRGTGKSTLLRNGLERHRTHWIDLLEMDQEAKYARSYEQLRIELLALGNEITTVVIDEVQRLPKLLNEVHRLIENDKVPFRFALTGSSARKLKAGGANLLAGRAVLRSLFPLTSVELGADFDLQKYLRFGGLPEVWQLREENEIKDYLRTYSQIYLKEEVWQEQLIRELEPFRRFLEVAAQSNGKILNYSNIARDTGVDPKTIPNWYSVLEDTLVGFHLDSFDLSLRKQMRKAPKFYLFDVGVARSLGHQLNFSPGPGTSHYGEVFEQFVLNQIYSLNIYKQLDYRLSYLQTKGGLEIDLVLWRPGRSHAFVEIKSSTLVDERNCKALMVLSKEFPEADFYVLSQDPVTKKIGNCTCLHFAEFLRFFGDKI